MSNLLQLQKGSKSFGAKKIFDEAEFAINEGEHVGVIGPNGAGKTTLFKILTGLDSLDSGTIIKAKDLRIGYLAQHDEWSPEDTVENFLARHTQIPLWDLKSLGRRLGIQEEFYQRKIQDLSGGYRMRCKLLNLLGQDPHLMMLDEPTNYLDLETTLVLENFLQGYKGAFLLISHDREFLRRTTDHVLEVEQGEMTKYNGNLDDYFEQKELLRSQLEARAMSLAEKRKNILDFVARFGAKATKAKQAQSRLKSLQKMETIEVKALPVKAMIKIPPPFRTGKQIVSMKSVDLGYGEKVILKNINFSLQNGDHLGVVGLNGAGKSTFLKALAQQLKPLRGEFELGYQVKIGYYAQHVAENIDPKSTVINEMSKHCHPDVTRQDALNMAGSLLFSGDDVDKKISVLSGGEKSRVALGQILLQKNPCLILDEPTNHLDFQTVEALTQALVAYEGTVVIVSHDRSFIRRVGTKILEIKNGQVGLYPGTYDEYVWSLEKGGFGDSMGAEQTSSTKTAGHSGTKSEGARSGTDHLGVNQQNFLNPREAKKNLEKTIRQLDVKLTQLNSSIQQKQNRLAELNDQIAQGTAVNLSAAVQELGQLQIQIDHDENQWIELSLQKEQAENDLNSLKK